jgi:hypothetical protein
MMGGMNMGMNMGMGMGMPQQPMMGGPMMGGPMMGGMMPRGPMGMNPGMQGMGMNPGMQGMRPQPAAPVVEDLSDPKVLLKPEIGGGLAVSLVFRYGVQAVAYAGAHCAYISVQNTKDHMIR